MRVMLVDDSTTMRRIQKNQLNKIGIDDVVEAGDGQDAYEKLGPSMPIDLVLLDWNMPIMDGLTFLKKVRSEEAYKDLKIVMCTSEAEKSRVFEAMKAGANNYIIKPFDPDTLKSKLKL